MVVGCEGADDPDADSTVKSLNFSTSSFFLVKTATGTPTAKALDPSLIILASTPFSVAS